MSTGSAPPGSAELAAAHFARLLEVETDCWDVHAAMAGGRRRFILLQTNGSSKDFEREHIPGAEHLPHAEIDEHALARWPDDTSFVVYCSGPHCNAADRAAFEIATLGRDVKKMIGGKLGWRAEGFDFATS